MSATMTRPRKAAKKDKPATKPKSKPEPDRTIEQVQTEISSIKKNIDDLPMTMSGMSQQEQLEPKVHRLENELEVLQAQALPAIDLELPEAKDVDLHIDVIDADGNHRDVVENDAATVELSKSLAATGQLQPIAVKKDGKRYRLIFGFRRLAAAKLLNWSHISARVYPAELNAAEEEAVRSAENLHRQELNYVEEARAVAQVMDRLREAKIDEEPARVVRAAEMLGKSQTWIRDRIYLARLSGKARKLVIDGRLGLKQAREISKLADPSEQDQIADMAARSENGTGGWSPQRTRSHVHEQLNSLKVVPWPLDAAFPPDKRIVGPCATCRFNTANDRNLFEHDDGETGEALAGRCTNQSCFDRKTELTQAALTKAVQAAVKSKDAGLMPAAPAIVKDSTYKRKVKSTIDAAAGGNGKATAKKPGRAQSYEQSPEEKAADKFREANSNRQSDARELLSKACAKEPALLVFGIILNDLEFFDRLSAYDEKNAAKLVESKEFSDLLKRFKSPGWKDIEWLVGKVKRFQLKVWNVIPEALTATAKALGVELQPAPKLEDFQPKAKAVQPEAAKK